jgi:hypothetical protein
METRASVYVLVALFLVAAVAGCGPRPAETADEALRRIPEGLAAGRPEVLWHALPPSYREDLTHLVHDAAAEMDVELWDRLFYSLERARTLLADKRDLLLSHPATPARFRDDPYEAARSWDAVIRLIDLVLQSDLSRADRLARLDIETFLATTGAEALRRFVEINELAESYGRPGPSLEPLLGMRVELVSQSGDTAVLRVEAPGLESRLVDYVRVEGVWISRRNADEWPTMIREARLAVSEFLGPRGAEKRERLNDNLEYLGGLLDRAIEAQTSREFDPRFERLLRHLDEFLNPEALKTGGR